MRQREFGPKLWRRDLLELKGSHGPHPPFPLGVSLTSLCRQTGRQTDWKEEEGECCW